MKSLRYMLILFGIVLLCACSSTRNDQGTTGQTGTTATSGSEMGHDMGTEMGTEMGHGDMGTEMGHDMGTEMGSEGAMGKHVDCSTVRCAACPEGQHPALKPPDCCRCIPN